ncbi:MAG: hypothetical protein J6J45_01015 [Clostridia bacterium]|nr:hypothetical protein [Clostridia bacterium]
MKRDPMPLGLAIFLLIAGLFLGSVFTFGMQYWNSEVTREDCTLIDTQFVSYKEIRQLKRPMEIKEIAVYCVNNERYFIDGVSINSDLRNSLSELSKHQKIYILIHPNSNTIVEFSTENGTILTFNETIHKLDREATGFLFLGLFMYFCSLVGLYYTAFHIIKKRNG